MKSYFFVSLSAHGALLAVLIIMGTLLSKPRLAYYAVDLMSSMPASSPAPAAPVPSVPEEKVPVTPPKPVVQEKPPPKEAIRMPSKEKKRPVPPKAAPPKPKHSAAFDAAMKALQNDGPAKTSRSGSTALASATGAGVVGEAGPTFPYPWYLKAIADKLDKQWHPSAEFQSDTVCTVAFTIGRDGQVSASSVEKASGDSLFDQLALRAVLCSSPLPPLPAGYPEATLQVHMKFVGKRS
jgi:periplasmic protein TonB